LQIDPAGCDERQVVQRPDQVIDDGDGAIEGNFDRRAARNIDAAISFLTFLSTPVYTQVSHRPSSAKYKRH
jgi:hypothetical protein